MTLGDRLRQLRLLSGMSQTEVEARSGVSQGMISQIETNRAIDPGIGTIRKLASVYGVTLESLLAESRPLVKVNLYQYLVGLGRDEWTHIRSLDLAGRIAYIFDKIIEIMPDDYPTRDAIYHQMGVSEDAVRNVLEKRLPPADGFMTLLIEFTSLPLLFWRHGHLEVRGDRLTKTAMDNDLIPSDTESYIDAIEFAVRRNVDPDRLRKLIEVDDILNTRK